MRSGNPHAAVLKVKYCNPTYVYKVLRSIKLKVSMIERKSHTAQRTVVHAVRYSNQ